MRRMGTCVDCTDGEDRELVSGQKDGHPRCRKHDMEYRRKQEEVGVLAHLVGRGHARYMKERNENFKRLSHILVLVREVTCWKEAHATTMKAILREYLQEELDTLRPRTLEAANGNPQP